MHPSLPLLGLLLAAPCAASASVAHARRQEQATPALRGVGAAPTALASGNPVAYARRQALLVGIDRYRDPAFPGLKSAVADARALAAVLVERYGFARDDVRLLLDEEATKAGLERALEDWASNPASVSADDLFLVYFAGHGVTRSLGDRGQRGYLVPVDARQEGQKSPVWSSLVGMNALEQVSEAIPARHALFVLDCCFGGLALMRSAPPVAAGLSRRARQILTAGDAAQPVLDSGAGEHSVFTGALLDALAGQADLDGDGVVTFGELFNHVGREVEFRTGKRQTPLQATFPDHEGGNVALYAPGASPGSASAADRLRALQRTSEEQLAELKRLADALLVQELRQEADRLWPAFPERMPPMRAWLARARRVLVGLPQHRESVLRVRQEAYLNQVLAGEIEEGQGMEPRWEKADPELRWRYETFQRLIEGLASLEQLLPGLEARLEDAATLARRSIEDHAGEWKRASDAVAADARFAGLELAPQLGLVPLGPDPDSGLWEFAAIQTGASPARAGDGRLTLAPDSAVVLVLVPGGSSLLGSQKSDEHAPGYDPQHYEDEGPPHAVALGPFFLSKFEVTQAQWLRWSGKNPSYYPVGFKYLGRTVTALHPVEEVSWEEAGPVLARFGFEFPTEAQWEHACRGGTATPWWTGAARDTLAGAINLADAAAARGGANWQDIKDWPAFDDGYTVHAPVDLLRPNPFGLHHMHGNVWEWCRDGFAKYGEALGAPGRIQPGDGEHLVPGSAHRSFRGGSFYRTAEHARSANRNPNPPGFKASDLGLRPMLRIRVARR